MAIERRLKVDNPEAIIWTEGKTDWKHLKAALGKLGVGLNISFQEYEDKEMGDRELLRKCKTFAETQQAIPLIFVFDNDNDDIVKKATEPTQGHKNWGNNVFSFAIPVPEHRKGCKNICIEMYYTDMELGTEDSDGRRLFFTSEFDERSGTHKEDVTIHVGNIRELKSVTAKEKAKIVGSGVFRGEASIALTKSDFADNIYNDISPFCQFDFREFSKIFDIIQTIIWTTKPKTNMYFPDPDEFFESLVDEPLSRQLGDIFECMINLLELASQIFIAATIRCYEDVIVDEPLKYLKKARDIKRAITRRFANPSLATLYDLTRYCFYLVDDQAPQELLDIRDYLDDRVSLGAIENLFDDLISILPEKKRKTRIRRKAKVLYILSEFSKYGSKINLIRSRIEDEGEDLEPAVETWQKALRTLFSIVAPMLSRTFTLTSVTQVDTVSGDYLVSIDTYKDGDKQQSYKVITYEEVEEYQDKTSELLMSYQNSQLPIALFPFLLIKDDKLFFYKRTRIKGYEYYSIPDSCVYIYPTKRKFNHSVFRASGKGSQQAFFWIEVLPSLNPKNNVRANIPVADRTGFVGREEQKTIIREEIIEIPNRDGMIYGLGGVGKTALMQQLSFELFEEENLENILFDNIIWVSAKSDFYNPTFNIIEKGKQQIESLDNIISAIFQFFEFENLDEYIFEDRKELVIELFKEKKILLILDNFETILQEGEADKIINFFSVEVKRALRKHPDALKVIITSRKLRPTGFYQVELMGLDQDESKELMIGLSEQHGSRRMIPVEQMDKIYKATSGIPIIIKHCFGKHYEYGLSIEDVIRALPTESNVAVEFSFKEIFELLKGDTYQLMIVLLLEIINCPLLSRQIAEILEIDERKVREKITTLVGFQCIKRIYQRTEEKYLVNDQARLFTRRLVRENEMLAKDIRKKVTQNFSIDKQMSYTNEEAGIVTIFDELASAKQYLDAEDFIKREIGRRSQSVLLNFHYAKFLRDQRRETEAIEILENIREIGDNHPSILKLLFSCYTSLEVPNYSKASIYAEELRNTVLFDDQELKLEIAEFYVSWSTSIKLKRKFDPRQPEEIERQNRYKRLADEAINILDQTMNRTHRVYYLLAQSYFNKWEYDSALRMINKALDLIEDDLTDYSLHTQYTRLKNAIYAKRRQFAWQR
jgi:hypothetical protein